MKNHIKIIGIGLVSIILASVLFFAGCDKIDDPYILGNFEPSDEPLPATTVKKVFVEDYTGISCVNCPTAAAIADNIAKSTRHRVVVLGIHAGYYATPGAPPLNLDFRTEEGNMYDTYYDIMAYPSGVINKKRNAQGGFTFTSREWETEIRSELDKPLTVKMEIDATIDDNVINGEIKYQAIENLQGDYKLLIYLAEDGIVGGQSNNNSGLGSVPVIENYTHHNVFRETINSENGWGISIRNLPLNEERTYKIDSYQIKSEKFEGSTYKIIAIIYNAATEYIEQVEEFTFGS